MPKMRLGHECIVMRSPAWTHENYFHSTSSTIVANSIWQILISGITGCNTISLLYQTLTKCFYPCKARWHVFFAMFQLLQNGLLSFYLDLNSFHQEHWQKCSRSETLYRNLYNKLKKKKEKKREREKKREKVK